MSEAFAADSSAIIAVLNREPEALVFADLFADAIVVLGWPTVLEIRLWMTRRAPISGTWFEAMLEQPGTRLLPFDGAHERLATDAFRRFGKGRHPAGLNFGDCMAYAVAMGEGIPLLFKGGDFPRTDIAVHPASVML